MNLSTRNTGQPQGYAHPFFKLKSIMRLTPRFRFLQFAFCPLPFALCFSLFTFHLNAQTIYSKRVEKLVNQMTLEEKVGQMTELTIDMISVGGGPYNITEPLTIDATKLEKVINKYQVGSVLNVGTSAHTPERWQEIITDIQKAAQKNRLKIPVLYGIDAIHGASYTRGSTLYPQPLAVACTRDLALAQELAGITAYECRASGIPWTYSPAMDLCKVPVWPRTWESFGEDVLLNTVFGSAMVKGYQGSGVDGKYNVLACMKHFTGYGAPSTGKDRTTGEISTHSLREYYLPQYEEAIKNGALTVMVNSGAFNGIPAHANKFLLTDILKGEMKFSGFAVSDWEDVKYLYSRHKVAKTYKDAVMLAVNAGIDMCMVPTDFEFSDNLVVLVKEGKVSMERIDDAVRRILYVKERVGLFDKPQLPSSDYPKFGSAEFAAKSKQAASESLVLLKNEKNTLPLPKDARALVIGPTANNMRSLLGGWSNTWQGENVNAVFEASHTVQEAIKAKVGAAHCTYLEGANFEKITNAADAQPLAKSDAYDYIILCLGENSYTETPGTISDITLDAHQLELTKQLAQSGKPIILVLLEGRPRIITQIVPYCSAIVLGFLPGPQGGDAIADVLYGDFNPSGKLPLSYPKFPNSFVPYDHAILDGGFDGFPTGDNAYYNPMYPFGHGLSFSTFKYENLAVNYDLVNAVKTLDQMPDSTKLVNISVDVTNTSQRDGVEVVELFTSQDYATVIPNAQRLKNFIRVAIKAGETKKVNFSLTPKNLSYINAQNKRVTESGDYKVMVGNLKKAFKI